jgi:hypothetical protein
MNADQLSSRANMLYPGHTSLSSMSEGFADIAANQAYRKGYQECAQEIFNSLRNAVNYVALTDNSIFWELRKNFEEILRLPVPVEFSSEPPIKLLELDPAQLPALSELTDADIPRVETEEDYNNSPNFLDREHGHH